MKKLQQKTVYVVGAGFSAGLGYPLTNDLLMRLWSRTADLGFKSTLERVMKFHNPGFKCARFSSFQNVEELLSQIVANQQLFDASRQYQGNFTKDDLEDLRRTLLLEIAGWFHDISKDIVPSEPGEPWLAAFRDRVRRQKAAVISFNWDLILDELLFGEKLDQSSYGFSSDVGTGPVIIKPHGSLNWFEDSSGSTIKADRKFLLFADGKKVYAFKKFRAPVSKHGREYMPLVVPPVYLKDFTKPIFRRLWLNCTQLLSTAREVVFLGYSMSAADFHAQFILRCGFHNQIAGELLKGAGRAKPTGAAKVVIVNPDRGAAERIEAIASSEHRCQWISKPVADLRWDRPRPFSADVH